MERRQLRQSGSLPIHLPLHGQRFRSPIQLVPLHIIHHHRHHPRNRRY